ncbi:hypothetical protein ADK54_19525 [Streptomyces sp. WM6378]|nr:hypothetical protein ADK54_19525 [Streptomyces sp. WM6378]
MPERGAGQRFEEMEDVGVLQVAAEQFTAHVQGQVGEVQGQREAVEAAQPLDAEHVAVLGQAEPVGHWARGAERAEGAHLVGDPAVLVQGLGKTLEPVQTVRVLLAHHHGADAGMPVDQLLVAQHLQGLAHGVAARPVVGGDGVFQGEHTAGKAARQDLVAQQVGELPGPVGTQPPAARGGDRKRGGGGFGWHGRERTGRVPPMVLPRHCAT